MADTRSVTVKLGMDTSSYESSAKRAAGATKGIGEGGEAAFEKIKAGAATAGKAAMDVFVGAGQAAVGLGVAALATGVSYNSLQQSSRAALTTILGSAQAANSQMDKLDAFAKQSPFSKSVWITAQQQMLGFGVAAEKVIPTLGAINDAVAAVGGNNQTVAELSYIFAQVSASGKITAEDLNQFGQRGVDAATLIGSQMGMTGQEIRDKITSGSLDAGEALDALSAGMTAKFGGAAANVKETWSGAVDRIKAAWRDLSSIIADPFVGKEGGGAAVGWANGLADTMRVLQAKIEPIWGGIIGNMKGAFDGVPDIFARLQVVIRQLDVGDIEKLVGHLKEIAPAMVGLGAGLTAGLSGAIPILRELPLAMNPFVAGIGALILTSPQARQALGALAAPAAILFDAFMQLASALSGPLASAVAAAATVLQPILLAAAGLAQGLAQVPGPILAVAAAFTGLLIMRGPLTAMWGNILQPMRTFGQEMRLQQGLASLSGQSLGTMGAGFAALRSQASGAVGGLRAFGSSLLGAVGGAPGLLITAAITAITVGLFKLGEANRAAARSAQSTASGFDGMVQAMKNANGQIDENVRASALAAIKSQAWGRESSNLADYSDRLGVSLTTQVDSLVGVAGASAEMEQAYQKQRAALEGVIATEVTSVGSGRSAKQVLNEKGQAAQTELGILDEQHAAYTQLQGASQGLTTAYQAEKAAVEGKADATQANMSLSEAAAKNLQEYALSAGLSENAIREMGAASGLSAGQINTVVAAVQSAGGAQDEMTQALDNNKAAADRARQALDFFSQAIDRLVGRNIDAQLAEQQLNDQVRAVEQAFKDGTAATNGHIESLIRADGTIDTTTEAGSKLFGTINDYRTAYDNATISAYQQAVATGNVAGAADAARAAATSARERFLAMAASQNISSEAAVALANKLGIVDGTEIDDKTFAVIANGLAQAKSDTAALDAMTISNKTYTITQRNVEIREIQQVNSGAASTYGSGGPGLWTGGPVWGPGTETSDSIHARLSRNEWVMRAKAVRTYGRAFMHAVNQGTYVPGAPLPGYADGGLVAPAAAAPAPMPLVMRSTTTVLVQVAPFDIRFTGDGPITDHMAVVATQQARQEISRQVRAELGSR